MEFRLLGDLEVVEGGGPLPLGGPKQRALLAALLLDPNHVVTTDRLIEALWGEQASTRTPANLHSLVSRLRRTLGPARIEHHAGGYLLRVQESEVDALRFERLRAEARLLPPEPASERLRLALDLWRGPPLADFTYDSWAGSEIQRLEELHVTAIEERIDADLEAGKHTQLIAEIRSLVAEHPLHEGFRRQLILALYRAGRQAEALEAYNAARRMLDEELGLEPSPALRELEGAVLRHDPALEAPVRPSRPAAPVLAQGTRKRGLALVAASAALAFAAAAAAVWWLEHDEGRRTVAAAAAAQPQTTPATRSATPREPVRRLPPRVVVRWVQPAKSEQRPIVQSKPAAARPRRSTRPSSGPTTSSTTTEQPVAPAVPPRPDPGPPPPPFRATDEFSDGVPGPFWRAHGSSAVSPAEREGKLEFAFAADAHAEAAGQWFGGDYESVCRYRGNFDLRVDYELLEWPAGNGMSLQLTISHESGFFVLARQSHDWGEQYNSWTRDGNLMPTTDVRGALRLRRRDGIVYSYYREGSAWSLLRTRPAQGPVSILLQAGSTDDFFGDEPVRAAFDNFSISAKSKVC